MRGRKRVKRIKIKCKVCKKLFEVRLSDMIPKRRKKYCSIECRGIARRTPYGNSSNSST